MASFPASERSTRAQLVVLLVGVLILLALSFAPGSQKAFVSAEVRFTDLSRSGLDIMPASCASSPTYYHSDLAATGYGYVVYNGQTEIGAYSPYAGMYVCVYYNSSGYNVFIPAQNAAELQSFKNSPPSGVSVY